MTKFLSNITSSPYLRLLCIPLITYAFLLGVKAYAQEGPTAEHAVFVANNVWMLVATFLVFIMHLGFATVEAGLTRPKNTINILQIFRVVRVFRGYKNKIANWRRCRHVDRASRHPQALWAGESK